MPHLTALFRIFGRRYDGRGTEYAILDQMAVNALDRERRARAAQPCSGEGGGREKYMAHTRLRPEWPIITYQYHVKPSWGSRLPDSIWKMAEQQQQLWNAMVDVWANASEAYMALLGQSEAVKHAQARVQQLTQQKDQTFQALEALRFQLKRKHGLPELDALETTYRRQQQELQQRKEVYKQVRAQAKTQVQPQLAALRRALERDLYETCRQCPLHWTLWQPMLDRFRTSLVVFFKRQGRPPTPKRGPISHLHFTWQHTSGGLPTTRLSAPRRSFQLTVQPEARWAAAHLGLGESPLPFRVRLHRPIPEEGYLKRVSLVGRQTLRPTYDRDHVVPAHYAWTLHLYLEVPPREGGAEGRLGPVAAIALGWRLIETRLRIGTLVDDAQHKEDLWQEPEHTPERLQLLRRWHHLARLHTRDAEALEATKTALAQLIWPDDLPGEILALRQTWTTVRHGGLTRLLRWAEIRNSWPAGVAILRRWATQHTRWYREWRGVEQRIQRRRRWLYEQQAMALCRRYRVIVLEAMDLRQMATSKTPAVAMNSAQQYRVLASLSEWRACLTRMAEKSDTTLIYCDPAHSKGETGDQDEEAVEKLLRWYRSAGVSVDEGDISGRARQKHEVQATQAPCTIADHQRSEESPHLSGLHIGHARHISDQTP